MEKEGYTILHDLLSKDLQLDEDEALISGEEKFHEAMQSKSKEEAASHIARLVLEREMQKVKTRLHYKTHRKF